MHVRKRMMRLIEDCIYVLYVITYALGKRVRQNEMLVFSDNIIRLELLNAIYRQVMQKISLLLGIIIGYIL